MKTQKHARRTGVIAVIAVMLCCLLLPNCIPDSCFGFARIVPREERALRMELVDAAVGWHGITEGSDGHRAIIDLYNTLDPLPVEYQMTYDDAWCAAFVTAAAIKTGLTEQIPPECSCPRQIRLFQELDRWEEDDGYLPLPGDVIYYDWDLHLGRDCTGSADHVGIVVGTFGPLVRVMEGNRHDRAQYRTIFRNDWRIRGYGLPDYT